MSNKYLTFADVEASHGTEAKAVWSAICAAGGFGNIAPTHDGGLDLGGLEKDVAAKVAALLGVKAETKKENK